MKHLRAQLKEVKNMKNGINPDADFVRETKVALMNRIATTQVARVDVTDTKNVHGLLLPRMREMSAMFIPHSFTQMMRSFATVTLALLLTTGGWVASASAQPGDALWGAKAVFGSMVERGQLAFADDTAEVDLNLMFASKRAQVIKDVATRQDISSEKKKQIIQETSADIEKQITEAHNKLDFVDVDRSRDLIKDVSLKTKEITASLQETADIVEGEGDASNDELVKDLNKSAGSSGSRGLAMVERVLEKKVASKQDITEEEWLIIKDHINSVVASIEKEAGRAKEKADILATDIEKSAQSSVGMNASTSTTSTSGVVSTSTTDGERVTSTAEGDTMTTVSTTLSVTSTTQTNINMVKINTMTKQQSLTSQEVVRDVQKRVTETVENVAEQKTQVEQLVEVDIVEALKKTRMLSESVSETVQEVSDVSKDVLPVRKEDGVVEEEIFEERGVIEKTQ